MRIGVVGLGYWGPNLVRTLVGLDQDVTVYDRIAERTRATAERFGVTAAQSLDAILDDASIAAVCIAVPVQDHASLFRLASRAGKHIFIEKPLCATVAEARELKPLLNGTTVMVGHITSFSPGLAAFRRQLREGVIGDLCSISCRRTHFGPIYSGTDVLTEVAAHDVAVLLAIKETLPQSIAAWGARRLDRAEPDLAHSLMVWGDGMIATVESEWTSALRQRIIVAAGTTGTLVFDAGAGTERVALHRQHDGFEVLAQGGRPAAALARCSETELSPDTGEPLRIELAEFLAAIREHRQPETGFEFSARVVALLDAGRESMRGGGREIRVSC